MIGIAVGMPMRIAFLAINTMHELVRRRVIWRYWRVVLGERIEHSRLRIDIDRTISGIPSRVQGFFTNQSTRFSISLASVISSMASDCGNDVAQNDDHEELVDLGLHHQHLRTDPRNYTGIIKLRFSM